MQISFNYNITKQMILFFYQKHLIKLTTIFYMINFILLIVKHFNKQKKVKKMIVKTITR